MDRDHGAKAVSPRARPSWHPQSEPLGTPAQHVIAAPLRAHNGSRGGSAWGAHVPALRVVERLLDDAAVAGQVLDVLPAQQRQVRLQQHAHWHARRARRRHGAVCRARRRACQGPC